MSVKKLDKVFEPIKPSYKDRVDFQKIYSHQQGADRLIKKYDVRVAPTLIYIDKNGNVVNRTEGFRTEAELKSSLDKLLKN